jgi:Lrp/AsnC family transcriptional regulator for asnA, asnC and gidA
LDKKYIPDKIDDAILRALSKDGKKKYSEIAEDLNISAQAISERVKKLKNHGIIKRFTIDIDPVKIGASIEFICELDINAGLMDEILPVLKEIPEIHIVKITTGIHDIMCIGNAESIENLHEVVEKKISPIKGVNKTYTSITMRRVKENQILNFDTDRVK